MRILIADDDTVARTLMAAVVEKLGHDCIAVADGDEAWERYRQERPDVLITDRSMPGLDGVELCRRIRSAAQSPYTYIVLVTAMDARTRVLEGMEAGADDYLVKPIDPFTLQLRLIAAQRVTDLHAQLNTAARDLARANDDLSRVARTDGLTGVGNRRRLDEDLEAVHARALRSGRPYAVAMIDLDHFKPYNDLLGHQAGDQVLSRIAAAVTAALREGDQVYRYGGEEFAAVFPDQQLPGAARAAERIRAAVQDLAIPHPAGGTQDVVTVSVGIADCRPPATADSAAVVAAADRRLYEAKAAGRNTVSCG